MTHDVELSTILEDMVEKLNDWSLKVNSKYEKCRDVDRLTIIVSHPHGCSMQVSVGHWVNRYIVRYSETGYNGSVLLETRSRQLGAFDTGAWGLGTFETRYTYTASTCPGSSGAFVYRLGYTIEALHPHSGSDAEGLNISCICGNVRNNYYVHPGPYDRFLSK